MSKLKGVLELDRVLAEFEEDILDTITAELVRIGRRVKLSEFEYNPFGDEVAPYVDVIRLERGLVILDTSFQDVSEKYLWDFISDLEINHRELVALLAFLVVIPDKRGNINSMKD